MGSAIAGQIMTDPTTFETIIFDGNDWHKIGSVGIANAQPVASPIASDEDDNLEQTVEILKTLIESYKKEVNQLTTTVKTLKHDIFMMSSHSADVEYIKELQDELRSTNKNSALLAPHIQHMSTKPLEVVTVALTRTDVMATESIIDPTSRSPRVHLMFKSGNRVYRQSTSSLMDDLSEHGSAHAVSITFDTMAAAIKNAFMEEAMGNVKL